MYLLLYNYYIIHFHNKKKEIQISEEDNAEENKADHAASENLLKELQLSLWRNLLLPESTPGGIWR